MEKHLPSPKQDRSQARAVSLLTSVSAVLGFFLWFGLLTPVSWSSSFLNVLHYHATIVTGLLTFFLCRHWRLPGTLCRRAILASSLAFVSFTPFLYLYSIFVWISAPPDRWDLAKTERVVPSPNGRMVARFYNLGPGFGGTTRVTVKIFRQWLPGVVEDMGIFWSEQRNAETGVSWNGDSAVIIYISGHNDERVSVNMFQWFPKPFIRLPFRWARQWVTK